MAINNSQRGVFAPELAATMTGSFVTIGTLIASPVIIIFDNQGADAVAISVDGGTTTWRTFPGGEALTLDLRTNHGIAPNFTLDANTTFSGNGTDADGPFSISYLYAANTSYGPGGT